MSAEAPRLAVPDGALAGRVTLIVGAQRGIGFACAAQFAAAGARVALADLPGSRIAAACTELAHEGATAHEADIADPASVDELLAEVAAAHGQIDILVNAAAILMPRKFLEVTVEEWDRCFAINTRGALLLAQGVAGRFVEQGRGGRIILFTSIIARSVVRPNNIAYCASKAAVAQAVRCMALELAPYDITVNAVAPGSTATEMLVDIQTGGDAEQLAAVVRGDASEWRLGIPLGRLASPDDQAAMAVFLASDAARHITGQEFSVDGGQTVV